MSHYIIEIAGAFDAIEWLKNKYPNMEAHFYQNPIGDGWCCDLGVCGAVCAQRSATAITKAEAAQLAAKNVATALGWQR